MNPERLLQHFERISEAPDAIPRLQQFILDLAVRGKLVEQDPNDEPAAELLKRIQAEKARLVKEDKIKQEKPIQSRANGSMPIELPKGWLWGCMQEICTSVTDGDHIPPPKSESGIPFLVIGDVRSQSIDFGSCRYVLDAYYQQLDEIRRPTKGDVLYTLVGSYGIPVVVKDDRPFCVQRHIGILRPSRYVNMDCLARILASRVVFDQATRCATGIAQKTVPLAGLRGILIPLPPLAEQHRIVTKVDELMALCDQLEAAKAEREQSRDRLVAASLHRLNSPADTAETDAPDLPARQVDAFRDHARFVFNHLPRLTTRPEHIKQLRQTILNLAVRGKLVPQDSNDELASDFLSRLAKEKIKAGVGTTGRDWVGGIKKDVPEAFPAPRGWTWTRIANAVERVTVGYVGPMKDQYVERGIPFLRSQNVRPNRFREDGLIHISPTFHRTIAKSALAPGDVVVVRSGNVGTACVIPQFLLEANCSDLVVVKNPTAVLPEYLCFYLNSWAISHIEEGSVGVALTHFNTKSVATIPLPLPPLAEQHRIVARVDELMALCDQLEAQLTATEADSRRLLEAMLHEALNPLAEVTEQLESVAGRTNAPQN